MIGAVEQIFLVLAAGWQSACKIRIDINMAGRAGAAAAAQRQKLVKTIVADHFHQAHAFISLNLVGLARTIHNNQLQNCN